MKISSSTSVNNSIIYPKKGKLNAQEEEQKVNQIIDEVREAINSLDGGEYNIIGKFLSKQDIDKRNFYLEKFVRAVRIGTQKELKTKYITTHVQTKSNFVNALKILAENKIIIPDFCMDYLDELFFDKTQVKDKVISGAANSEIINLLKVAYKNQPIPKKMQVKLAASINHEYLFFADFIDSSLEILKNSPENLSKEAIEQLNKANSKYAEREDRVFEGQETRFNRIAILKLLSKKGVFNSNNLYYAKRALELYERRSKDSRIAKEDNFDKEKLKLKKLIAREEPRVNKHQEYYKIAEAISRDKSKISIPDIATLMNSKNIFHQQSGVVRVYENYILKAKNLPESIIKLIDKLGSNFITEKSNIGYFASISLLNCIIKRSYINVSKESIEAMIKKMNDDATDPSMLSSLSSGINTLILSGNFKPATEFLSYKDTISNQVIFKALNSVFTRDGKLPSSVLSKLVSVSTNQISGLETKLEATSILSECKFALSKTMLFNLRKNIYFSDSEGSSEVIDLTKNILDSTSNTRNELENREIISDINYQDSVFIDDYSEFQGISEIKSQATQNQDIQKVEDKTNKPLNKDQVILELIEKNQDNQDFVTFIRGELVGQFDLVNKFYKSDSSIFPQNDSIQNWSESKIKKYAANIKEKPELFREKSGFCELISVISRLNFLQNGYNLRDIQVMSVLTILNANEKGRLLQIGTGEGKSTTTATIAAIKALQGESVDVITSSSVLAKRDSEEWEKFFKNLDVTSGHNIDLDYTKGSKECYKAQVVYGDASTFQADYLKQSYKDLGTRGSRNFETVIIDEVDSMLIDESSKLVKLSSQIPGSEYLSSIFIASFQELKKLDKQIIYLEAEKSHAFIPGNFSYDNGKLTLFDEGLKDQGLFILDDVDSFKEKHLVNYIQDIISQNAVLIPSYLKDQAYEQINDWANSAVKAQKLQQKKHYLIVRDNQGDEVIAPIDYLNTGNIQGNTVWENGLQQFLQVKHGIKVTAESNTTSFISNMGYFRKYGNRIYGLTGTLGDKNSQKLLEDIYNIDIGFIPNYKKRNFEEIPPIVTDNDTDLIKNIIESTIYQTSKGKAVLILCETINDAETIEDEIKKHIHNFSKIIRYSRNDNEEIHFLKDKTLSKQVIIATNLAGRGTDIRLSEKVISSGGLHVCITFLPTNSRVEAQGFGRASRQGQNGSGQLIVKKSDILKKLKLDSIADVTSEQLKIIRDVTQESHIKNIRENEVDRLITNDDLFTSYSKLYHSLKSQENAPHKLRQVEELWGIKLKQIEKNYKASTDDNATKGQMSFTEFENFASQISDAYSSNTIMKNPTYLLLHGYNKMGSGGDYKESIKIMEDAAKLDDIYNFAVNYHLAYARLRQGYKEAAQKGRGSEKYIAYKNEVYANLANAKASIDQAIIPSLQALQINQDSSDTPLLRQTQAKLQLYNLISSNIASAMDTIKNGGEYEAMKINGPQKTLKDYFENKSSATKEITELSNFGMFTIYDVGFERLDGDALFNEMATFALSAVQFVAGATLCATGSAWIGASLIAEGISDLKNTANGHSYSENFSWDKYFEGKAIAAGVTLMTAGLEKALAAAKATKTVSLTQVSQTLSKTAVNIAVKQSAKEVIVKTIVRTSLNIVLNEAADRLAKKVIKDNSGELIQRTRNKLRAKLNSSPSLDSLNQIFSFDAIMNNTNRANLLQSSISEIPQVKRHLFSEISSSLSSSMISSQNSIVSSIGIVSKTVEVANNLNKTLELAEEFVSLVESKIATSKEKLTPLLGIIRAKLGTNLKSDKEATELLSILENAGIYKNGEFVESKINYLEPTTLVQNTSNVTTPLTFRELSQDNIDTIDLGKFSLHRTKIKEVLHQIHRSKILNHSSKIESLVEHSVQVLESGFNSRLRGGVIMQVASPLVRHISSQLGDVVVDGIARAVNGVMDGVGNKVSGNRGANSVEESGGSLNGNGGGNAYTSSGEEESSRGIIDKVRDGLRKVFGKKGRGEGDNGEVVFDEGSFGESVANDNTVFLSSEGGGLQLDSSKEIIYIDTSDKNTRFIDTEFDPILPYSNQEIVAMSRMLHDTISKNRLSVDASLNLISVAGGVYGRVVAGIINGTLIARDIKDGRYSTIIADSGEIGMIPVPNRGINFNFARSSSRGKGVLLPGGNIVSSGNTQLMTFVGNGKSNNIGTNISINDIDPRILEKIDPRFYKALEIMNSSGWKIARGESVFGVERQLVGSSNALALVGSSNALALVGSSNALALVGSSNALALVGKNIYSVSGNVNSQVALNKKLSALQEAQDSFLKIKNLPDGRIRYYAIERKAKNSGATRGASYVTEFNPKTGQVRSWMESYDHFGNVNRVHPKMIDGQYVKSLHYPYTKLEIQTFFKNKVGNK